MVERVRMPEKHITVEGAFSSPELARLSLQDQVFVTAFLRSHGSIKEMEQVFGVSYPTIKARLNRIAGLLEFVDTNPSPSRAEVLERLNRGEINADLTAAITLAAAVVLTCAALYLEYCCRVPDVPDRDRTDQGARLP